MSLDGDVLVGSPPPTRAQIKELLVSELSLSGRAGKIGRLLRNGGYSLSFNPLITGKAMISWYSISRRGRSKRSLVATTGKRSVHARTVSIKIKLTASGEQLLARATHLSLTANGSITANGNPAVTTHRLIQLHR